jgi:hypothetical protein
MFLQLMTLLVAIQWLGAPCIDVKTVADYKEEEYPQITQIKKR